MKHFPGTIPGDDTEGYTLEGARAKSFNCVLCCGHGMAPIYDKARYQGSAVEDVVGEDGPKAVVVRALAYCLCPAGRKTMILHQSSGSKRLIMPDIHDVIAGNHRGWVVDDPTFDPNEPINIEALPIQLRALAAKLKAPRLYRGAS